LASASGQSRPQRADWSAELQLERPDGGRVAGQASCSAISIEASMGNLLIEGQPKYPEPNKPGSQANSLDEPAFHLMLSTGRGCGPDRRLAVTGAVAPGVAAGGPLRGLVLAVSRFLRADALGEP
jgi:hypothetical protein